MHIRQATFAEVSEIATVTAQAVRDDELCLWISPYLDQHYLDFRDGMLRRCKWRFYTGMLMLVMVTDSSDASWNATETIVGHAALHRIIDKPATRSWNNELNKALDWAEERYRWLIRADKSLDRLNYLEFRRNTSVNPFKDVKDAWELDLLIVSPELQHRQIGTKLLQEALRIAHEDGVPLQLIASKPGEGLYRKSGMKEVKSLYVSNEITAKCFSTTLAS